MIPSHRDHSRYGISQWEDASLCNAFSHWPRLYSEWSPQPHWQSYLQNYNAIGDCIYKATHLTVCSVPITWWVIHMRLYNRCFGIPHHWYNKNVMAFQITFCWMVYSIGCFQSWGHRWIPNKKGQPYAHIMSWRNYERPYRNLSITQIYLSHL